MTQPIRPSIHTFNSWDETRFSRRIVPTLDARLAEAEEAVHDAFERAGVAEVGAVRRPSIRVDEANPAIPPVVYRLGWRSVLQIWATVVASTTLGIATYNLYNRTHGDKP